MRDVMKQRQIKSPAFQIAELQSERLRIFGVAGFTGLFVVVTVLRTFVLHTVSETTPWISSLFLALAIAGYEFWALRRVDNALKADVGLGPGFWIISTALETSIPAFAIAFLANPQIAVPYRPLASPAILVFCILIILSTLRLSLGLGVLAGLVAAGTYICAALYLGWRPPVVGTPASVTTANVSLNALALLLAGVIAGVVARQIRNHLLAALREAETKRSLEAIQHDLKVARSIQQSLLPQAAPTIAGFDIAGWNLPADDTGGDYFDWKFLPNGKLVISLADVTGHGIGPALLAAVCHAYARSNFSIAQDLQTALGHINEDLGADLTPGRFVTFVAATCCAACSDVQLLSAGHGPLFIYSRLEDQVTGMNAHALPFGILPSFASDPPTNLTLRTGDLVVLATDGFFEWENDQSEQFGAQRLEDVIRASRDSSSAEIIEKLYDAVIAFAGGTKQQDDLTAVVIKRL